LLRPPLIGKQELATFLALCDADFSPPLSQRTNLEAYAEKLLANAQLAGARQQNEIVGLAAFYCNDLATRRGYVTYLAVKREARGSGLGAQLIEKTIEISAAAGMETLELQTDQDRLVEFYKRLGFEVIETYSRFGGYPAFRLRRRL
jgi:ribosomal protein S18 acetylase RimI-like enzyme